MLKTQIKTASDLRDFYEEYHPRSDFFHCKTMKFFGDTMRNYGVRKASIHDILGCEVSVWELYRKNPVKHGLQGSTYFDTENFTIVYNYENHPLKNL